MGKSLRFPAVTFALLSMLAAGDHALKARAQAPGQYPVLDLVANKVIGKYQQSTCEQLWQAKSAHTPPGAQEQQLLGLLHANAEMRAEFINKVAAPIVNKMFECGMIP